MSALRRLSDAEIVHRARGGDGDACRELVERYQRPILSLVARMVRDRELAEDLAQETFIKAFRYLDRFDPQRKLSSWLFKIAHNTTLDHLRRKRLDTTSIDGGEEEVDTDRRAQLATPDAASPDRAAERSELMGGLDVALGQLDPRYREVLLLRFREGLAYQEIAEVTGQPINTVKVHLHRARHRLAKLLAEQGFEAPERFG